MSADTHDADATQGAPPAPAAPAAPASRQPLPPQLRRVIAAVVLGSVMIFLDSTIVNVALRTLSERLGSSLAGIQWVVTAYLLALAAVIPASGWLSARFGAKRLFTASVLAFTAASVACALSTTTAELISFRAVQGAAGGLALPVGQAIVMRESGPALMARTMSAIGIPTILMPVIGPTLGGLVLEHASWRWIFYLNVPVGIAAAALAHRLLPADPPGPGRAGRLDVLGLLLVVLGSVGITYGLAEVGSDGHPGSAKVLGSLVGGALLLAAFVLRTLKAAHPLVDLRLYRSPAYSAASLTTVAVGAAAFGAIILMPLYFQIVRGESTVGTGLLLIPQGAGTTVAIWLGARLNDRLGGGPTSLLGGVISIVGTVPFLFLGAHTDYWLLGAAMAVRGFGVGVCAMPAMTSAYRAIPPSKIGDATVQLSVLQRIGGSVGTAAFAVVLQRHLAHAHGVGGAADSFAASFWWVLAVAVAATLPAVLLTGAERRTAAAQAAKGAEPAAG